MGTTHILVTCPSCGKERLAWKSAVRKSTTGLCHPCAHTKHNASKGAPLYQRWKSIKQRCCNPRDRAYQYYGGRGVFLHPSWFAFKTFRDDILREIGPCPSPKHQLDRVLNDGPYAPNNVRWATRQEQQNNTRANRHLIFNGEIH